MKRILLSFFLVACLAAPSFGQGYGPHNFSEMRDVIYRADSSTTLTGYSKLSCVDHAGIGFHSGTSRMRLDYEVQRELYALWDSPLGGAQDGKEALQTINGYRASLYKSYSDNKQRINYQEVSEKVKAKAVELTKGVDFAKVDPKTAYDWARVVEITGDSKTVCDLIHRYLTTNPPNNEKFDAMLLMSRSCNALGEADMLSENLKTIPVPDSGRSSSLAYATVGDFADTIYEKKGLDRALAVLGTVEKKLIDENPKDYAKRVFAAQQSRSGGTITSVVPNSKAKTDQKSGGNGGMATLTDPNSRAKSDAEKLAEYEKQGKQVSENLHFMFAEKRSELYKEAGKKDLAVKTLKTAIGKLSKDSPMVRRANGELLQMTMSGNTAPAIVSERSYGTYNGLDSLKGKVVIIDFFAHWCGPCIASFPDMEKMYADLHDKGLEVVGVTTYYGFYGQEHSEKRDMAKDDEYAKMADFIKKYNMPWPVVYGERSNMESYGVTGIPTAVLIGRDGKVHELHVGYSKESFVEFRKEVEKLVSER